MSRPWRADVHDCFLCGTLTYTCVHHCTLCALLIAALPPWSLRLHMCLKPHKKSRRLFPPSYNSMGIPNRIGGQAWGCYFSEVKELYRGPASFAFTFSAAAKHLDANATCVDAF